MFIGKFIKNTVTDSRSFRKRRYDLIYENLENYIGSYRKSLNNINEEIVFNIITFNRTERVEALMKNII